MLKEIRLSGLTTYYKLLRVLEDCTNRTLRAQTPGVRATHRNVVAALRSYANRTKLTPTNGAITTALLYAKNAGEAALSLEKYMHIEARAADIVRESRRAYVALGTLAEQTGRIERVDVEALYTDTMTPAFKEFLDALLEPEGVA